MSTPTVLPATALTRLAPAGGRTGTGRFLRPALLRGVLCLAAVAPLLAGAQPWPAAAAVLVAGWGAVAALPGRRRRPVVGLGLGACQAAAVVLLWRAGQDVTPAGVGSAALLPVLAAVPLIEIGVSWQRARLTAALARHEDREQHLRYLRRLCAGTLTALLPPLLAGAALAATATRLPYGLSAHPDAPPLVLAMAAGVLLAGVLALGRLLAAHHRPGPAALLTAAPGPAAAGLALGVPELAPASLTGWGGLLPALAVMLSLAYAAGLVLATQALFSPRSSR